LLSLQAHYTLLLVFFDLMHLVEDCVLLRLNFNLFSVLLCLAEVLINALVERIKLKEFFTFMLREQESWYEVLNDLTLELFYNIRSDNYR
jgi:hypothetical protein